VLQLFSRGLVTRAVGDDEETEMCRREKERKQRQDDAVAAAEAQPPSELRRGTSLPGLTESHLVFTTHQAYKPVTVF